MNETAKTKSNFLQGAILPPLICFALPLMGSQLLQALYSAVDLAVIGRFAPTASTAAVANGGQIMQAITGLVTGLTMGVTVLVGKAAGGKNRAEAGRVVAGQIRLFFLMALALTALTVALAPAAVAWMNVPEPSRPQAIAYLRICGSGMIFVTAYNGISGVFRGLGNSRSPLLFVVIACAINVVLDLVFVAGLGLDAAGAALATVTAQAGSVLFSVLYLRFHPLPFTLRRESFRGWGSARRIAALGTPIALQDFLVSISFLIITSIVNRLGVAASAGIGITEKLFVFLALVPMAFMSALSAFVAQNMGAGQPDRARRALVLARRISTGVGVCIFLLTFFGGGVLASFFEDDPEVIAAAATYFKSSSLEYLLSPAVFCMLGYFNGQERTTFVMIQGLASAFLVRVPLSWLFSIVPGAGLFTIGMAVPLSALFNLAVCLWYDRRLKKAG